MELSQGRTWGHPDRNFHLSSERLHSIGPRSPRISYSVGPRSPRISYSVGPRSPRISYSVGPRSPRISYSVGPRSPRISYSKEPRSLRISYNKEPRSPRNMITTPSLWGCQASRLNRLRLVTFRTVGITITGDCWEDEDSYQAFRQDDKGQRADSGGPDFSPLTVCVSTHSQTMTKQAHRRLTYAHTDKVARFVFKTSVSVFPADTTDWNSDGRRSLQFRGQWHDLHTVTDELKTKMTEDDHFNFWVSGMIFIPLRMNWRQKWRKTYVSMPVRWQDTLVNWMQKWYKTIIAVTNQLQDTNTVITQLRNTNTVTGELKATQLQDTNTVVGQLKQNQLQDTDTVIGELKAKMKWTHKRWRR